MLFRSSLKSQIRDARSQSRGHPLRKMVIGASTDMYKHSFIPRSIPIWNSLPADIVCSATALEFASRLAQSRVKQFINEVETALVANPTSLCELFCFNHCRTNIVLS